MYDVIVIGAGPAGNIAALRLSGMGYKVAVVDWRHNLGDKLCTGIIGAECARHYPPDDAHVYREARAATVVSPAGRRYRVARQDTQALIIDRIAYVESMAHQAMEAGAEYRLGPRVTNIEVDASGVAVTTNGRHSPSRQRAKLAIIASGFGSPLLDMVGLGSGRGRNYMSGAQAEVSVSGLEDTEVYLGDHIAPGSFGWLVPLEDSRALAGLLSRQRLNGHMADFLAALRSDGKVRDVVTEPRKWGIPLKPLNKTYTDRVLVVGDAAGFAKPTTGGGIYYAIRSGEIAAEVANEAFVDGDLSSRFLKRYQRRWKGVMGRELSIGYYARMLYEALGDRRLEYLLSASSESGVQDELINSREFSFDWHSGIIRTAVSHRTLGVVIKSFGPMVAPFLSRLVGGRSK